MQIRGASPQRSTHPSGRLIGLVLMVAVAACGSDGAEVLRHFVPAGNIEGFGPANVITFETPPVVLEPASLAHHSHRAMKRFRFEEPVWVIEYSTETFDDGQEPSRENYLCHTFFGDQRVVQRQDQQMRALYSDSFTRAIRLPEGFGVRYGPDDDIEWMPMFNNRRPELARVVMRVQLTVIRESELVRPLQMLYSTMRSVQVPHLFYVEPGRHEQKAEIDFSFNGTIHFLGAHMHPYGMSAELLNATGGESVWRGNRITDDEGRMTGMETYSSAAGYPVRAGETYVLTSVYENTTPYPIDAMAGLFVFYSLN